MALEDILRALEDKAQSRIGQIESESQQRVNEIIAEAEREAARTRRMRLKKVEEMVRSEATSIVYSASLKGKNLLISAQEAVVDEAFRVAETHLAELHGSEKYPLMLRKLVEECLEFFPGEVMLQVRDDDRAFVEKIMADVGRPYRFADTPLEASGGVVAASVDGEVVVQNTFESRLERAKDKLRLEMANRLFGS